MKAANNKRAAPQHQNSDRDWQQHANANQQHSYRRQSSSSSSLQTNENDQDEEDWAVRQIPPSAATAARHHYQTPMNVHQQPLQSKKKTAGANHNNHSHPMGRQGLVLDPAAPHNPKPAASAKSKKKHGNNNNPFHAASKRQPQNQRGQPQQSLSKHVHFDDSRLHQQQQNPTQQHNTTIVTTQQQQQQPSSSPSSLSSAAHFAKDAPMAGFLHKYGQHVTEFKRRFFVLQPATHLYYFLSPNDAQPRGCLDLTDSWIETLADGTASSEDNTNHNNKATEFCICWPNHHKNTDKNTGSNDEPRRVWLQASDTAQAEEWQHMLQTQRLDVALHTLQTTRNQMAGYTQRVADLEIALKRYKLMERDRDGALQEADARRRDVQRLESGLQALTQWIQQRLRTVGDENDNAEETTTSPKNAVHVAASHSSPSDENDTVKEGTNSTDQGTRGQQTDQLGNDGEDDSSNAKKDKGNEQGLENQKTDQGVKEEDDPKNDKPKLIEQPQQPQQHNDENIDITNVPGPHFSNLHNACRSLEAHWKLAVQESTTAVHDLNQAHTSLTKVQKRLTKAEQQLLKLWGENCDLRQQLKQRKTEKRVLVQEVKHLQQRTRQLEEEQQQQTQQQQNQRPLQNHFYNDNNNDDNLPALEEEEDKLINELEESLSASIELHEEMLRASKSPGKPPPPQSTTSTRKGSVRDEEEEVVGKEAHSQPRQEQQHPQQKKNEEAQETPVEPNAEAPAKSLFDDESDDEEEEESEMEGEESSFAEHDYDVKEIDHDQVNDLETVSSVQAEMGDAQELGFRSALSTPQRPTFASANDAFLDETKEGGISPFPQPPSTSNTSLASTPDRPNPLLQLDETALDEPQTSRIQPLVTNSGHATSALACPLADVVGRSPGVNYRSDGSNLNNELDVYHLTFYSQKIGIQFQKVPPPPAKARGLLTEALTADLAGVSVAEEKTAAELRRIATLSTWAKSDESPSTKKGEVLSVVTPDDAVLVCGFQGFDDSGTNVRPKLGARLVAFDGVSVEVGKWTFESIRKAIQMRGRPLTLSFRDDFLTTEQRRVLTKAVKEMEPAMQQHPPRPNIQYQHRGSISGQMSVSTASIGSYEADTLHDEGSVRSIQSSRSTTWNDEDSVPSHSSAPRNHHRGRNFRSFSEAGSSTSSVLSAVGPLMANLLNKSTPSTPFTPEYMRRPQISVEDTPQHQDFKAGLL